MSSIAKPSIQHQPWCDTTDHESDEVSDTYGSNDSIGCGGPSTELQLSGGGVIGGHIRAWDPGSEPVALVEFPESSVLTMADVEALVGFFSRLLVVRPPRVPRPRTGD